MTVFKHPFKMKYQTIPDYHMCISESLFINFVDHPSSHSLTTSQTILLNLNLIEIDLKITNIQRFKDKLTNATDKVQLCKDLLEIEQSNKRLFNRDLIHESESLSIACQLSRVLLESQIFLNNRSNNQLYKVLQLEMNQIICFFYGNT